MPAASLGLGGLLLLAVGLVLIRRSGARPGMGRRLAGARSVRVGELLDLGPRDPLPRRPVRVVGRIRCAEPIVTSQADRLVAFHRDVEVSTASGGWRSIERLRETRSFELWDHDGSIQVDPGLAAEPLVVLPHVWTGSPDELDESYEPALARVTAEHGSPVRARATTRMVSVVDRLLLLATITRDANGPIALVPPGGGYIISALELEDAMRLLGGPRPRLMLAGMASVAVALALLGAGAFLLLVALIRG
ncbi:MAG: hypothetical protein ACXWMB_06030 [Candidatus Limnocylindria bacterium]